MERPNILTVINPIAIAVITNGSATRVNFPAPNKLKRIPKNIIPIRNIVVAQNFKPICIVLFKGSVLAIIIPIIIAIMMSLIGERLKPKTSSPIHFAAILAIIDTLQASNKPNIQPKFLNMSLEYN